MTIGLGLLLLAVLVLIAALRLRAGTGLPWVPVRYNDAGARNLEKPLVARRIGLTGKPDYVIEQGGRLIPVEVKPGRQAGKPYESDLMQLAAYCVLVEETSGTAPPYGLLRYAGQTFRMRYTPQVREQVLLLVEEMRALLDADTCRRNHREPWRCRGCGFREQCDEALD